jgi:CubicO group peptidase (beta-lactamase class C family)
MKFLKRVFLVLIFFMALYGAVYMSTYQYLLKGIRLTYLQGTNSAHFTDWYGFDTRSVDNGSDVTEIPTNIDSKIKLTESLKSMLAETESGSYLVFRNDTLVYEEYFNGFSDTHHLNSFSMAKTITTLMVQRAIELGYIESWDSRVKKYLPWLQGQYAEQLTLRHLSTMTAGLDWDEHYKSPFGITAEAYYTEDVLSVMKRLPIIKEPGTEWKYQSGSTQILSFVLGEALKRPAIHKIYLNDTLRNAPKGTSLTNIKLHPLKTYDHISEFASDVIWKPLGMEASALWSLDHENGNELGFCCVNAISRDFGRLGLWVLNKGVWGNARIDSQFLSMAVQPYKDPRYGHSFWISSKTDVPFYYFQGLNGQYICIIPSQNMVVVRTGKHIKKVEGDDLVFSCVKTYVSEAVALFGKPRK